VLNLQDEDAEPDPYRISTLAYGGKVQDQNGGPEARLEAVHREEGAWFKRVAQEEENRKGIDEDYDDDEEHEYNDRPAGC
jgi:hypothetical protein